LIDRELIEECRNGNFRNFRKVVTIASPFAFSVAYRILGDEDLAKDVVQETMVTIWEKMNRIKSSESFKTWLYRIVVNKCYDQFRMRKRIPEQRADEKTWEMISNNLLSVESSELENSETALIIQMLTQTLSPKQKAVFVLSDLEEMTPEEVSEITGLTRMNVKANLHYARKNISGMIKKYL